MYGDMLLRSTEAKMSGSYAQHAMRGTVSRSSAGVAPHPIIPLHNTNTKAQLFSSMWCKSSLKDVEVLVCEDFA